MNHYATCISTCTHCHCPHCWNVPTASQRHIHCLVSIDVQKWMSMGALFFSHWGINFPIFVSSARPCQAPLCQTAPLLPSVTWQQNVKEYWWEDSASAAIPPPFASDGISQSEWKALLLEQPLYFCCSLLYTSANIRVFVSVPISTSTTIACVKTDLISRQRHVEISYPF